MGSTISRRKSLSMHDYGYRGQEKLDAVHALRLLSIHFILTIRLQTKKRKDLVHGNCGYYVKIN